MSATTQTTNPADLAGEMLKTHPESTMPEGMEVDSGSTLEKPKGEQPAPKASTKKTAKTISSEYPLDSLEREFRPGKFKTDEFGKPRTDSIGRFIPEGVGRKPKKTAKKASTVKAKKTGEANETATRNHSARDKVPSEKTANATSYAQSNFSDSEPMPDFPPVGSVNSGEPGAKAGDAEPPPAATPEISSSHVLGVIYTQAGISVAMAIFGKEWKPDSAEEFHETAALVSAYIEAKGLEELSPEWALLIGLTTYAGKRFPRPTTQSRISAMWSGVRNWWKGRSNSRTLSKLAKEQEKEAA